MVLLAGSSTALSFPDGEGGHVTSETFRVGVDWPLAGVTSLLRPPGGVCPPDGGVTSETRPGEDCPGGVPSDTRLLGESFSSVSSESFLDGEGEGDDSSSANRKKKKFCRTTGSFITLKACCVDK